MLRAVLEEELLVMHVGAELEPLSLVLLLEIEAHSFSDHGGSFRTHKFIPKFIPKSIQSGQQCSFQLQDIS